MDEAGSSNFTPASPIYLSGKYKSASDETLSKNPRLASLKAAGGITRNLIDEVSRIELQIRNSSRT
jgi:hypothetical protein